jgi:hypothetical protein
MPGKRAIAIILFLNIEGCYRGWGKSLMLGTINTFPYYSFPLDILRDVNV